MRQYAEGHKFVRTVVEQRRHRRVQPDLGVAGDLPTHGRDRRPARLDRPGTSARPDCDRPRRPGRGRPYRGAPHAWPKRRAGRGGDLVLVACSGGADSLALAAATAFVAPRAGPARRAGHRRPRPAGGVGRTRRGGGGAGPAPRASIRPPRSPWTRRRAARVRRPRPAPPGTTRWRTPPGPPEPPRSCSATPATTRPRPYCSRWPGAPACAGSPACHRPAPVYGVAFLRPLLDVPRAQTRRRAGRSTWSPWEDPHNSDPAYARARVRAALPLLADLLGPGVVANLARTARLAAADLATLDALAAAAPRRGHHRPGPVGTRCWPRCRTGSGAGCCAGTRWISARRPAHSARCTSAALDALVMAWHGQGPVALPGSHHVARVNGHITRVEP